MSLKSLLLKVYFFFEGLYYKLFDFLQKHGVPVYKLFVQPLEENRIPSFPVFILLVLIILSGLAFLLLPKPGVSTGVFVVRVLSNKTAVDNATVVFLGFNNAFLSRVSTDATGTAVFNGGALTADVIAQGFVEKKIALTPGLNLISLQASNIQNTTFINTTTTNSSNNTGASFSSQNTTLPGNGQSLNGSSNLEVDLSYNNAPVDGFVTVLDNSTSYVLDSGQTSGGSVYFSSISLGSTVFFTVSGNYSLYSSPVISLKNGNNDVVLNVSPLGQGGVSCASNSDCPSSSSYCVSGFCSSSNNSQNGNGGSESYIYLINSVSNSSVNGYVAVFNLDNQLVFQGSTVNGSFAFNAIQGYYYALVNAPGFVDGQSAFFQTPVNYSVFLNPITMGSASLVVNIFDDQGNPLTVGSVVLKSFNNDAWELLTQPENNSNGMVSFSNLPVNTTVEVVASDGRASGINTTFLLNGLNNASVYLFVNNGFLNVSAFDALTGNPITDFNASVSFSNILGNFTVSCSPSSNDWCLLNVESNTQWLVNFTASGYYSDTMPASVDVNSTTAVNDSLTPTGVGGLTLAGVYDSNWGKVSTTQTLYLNSFYHTCFNIHTNTSLNALSSGFFFTSNPTVNISSWNSTLGVHGGVNNGCPDPTSAALIGGNYSSINLTTTGSLNGLYCVGFTPVSNGEAWDNLSLDYSSFALFPNASFSYPLSSSNNVCGVNLSSSYYSVSSPNDVCGSGCGNGLNVGNLSVSMSQILSNGMVLTCGDGQSEFNCNNFQAYSDPAGAGLAGPLNVSFYLSPASVSSPDLLIFNSPGNTVLSVNLTSTGATALPVNGKANEWDVSEGLASNIIDGYVLVNLTTSSSSTSTQPVSSPGLINVNFSNGSASIGESFKINSTPLYPPNVLAGFDCAGVPFINLTYDVNLYMQTQKTGWQASCNNIPMVVSDVFPGDAVKVYLSGNAPFNSGGGVDLLYGSGSNPNPLANCFGFDDNNHNFYSDSNGVYGIMRFSPYYQGCPLAVVGNGPLVWKANGSVAGNLTLTYPFAFEGENANNCPSWTNSEGGVSWDCKSLNFTVSSISTGEGLNLLPVATSGYVYNTSTGCVQSATCGEDDVSGNAHGCTSVGNKYCLRYGTSLSNLNTYPLNPQVWVFLNNNQLSGLDNGGSGVGLSFDSQKLSGAPFSYSFDSPQAIALGIESGSTPQIFVDGFQSPDLTIEYNFFELLFNSYPVMIDSWLNFYNPSLSAFIAALIRGLPPSVGGVVNNENSYSVGDYLNYINNTILYSTALWRSSSVYLWCEPNPADNNYDNINYCRPSENDWFNYSAASSSGNPWLNTTPLEEASLSGSSYADPGAPLKYFSNTFSFFKVFDVVGCAYDSCFNFGKTDTLLSNNVQCNPVADGVNTFLQGNPLIFNGVSLSHMIPRGVYVVNYTYSIDSNGNPVGGYYGAPGWSIISSPLVLNNSNYYQPNTNCDLTSVPSTTPLCGYVFSTNNNVSEQQTVSGLNGIGNCILSSYTFNNGDSSILQYFVDNSENPPSGHDSTFVGSYFANQLSPDNKLYFSSLIPIGFMNTHSPHLGGQTYSSTTASNNFNVGDFEENSNGGYINEIYNPTNLDEKFMPFFVDSAGDIGIPYPTFRNCHYGGSAKGWSCGDEVPWAVISVNASGVFNNSCLGATFKSDGSGPVGIENGKLPPALDCYNTFMWPNFNGLGLH